MHGRVTPGAARLALSALLAFALPLAAVAQDRLTTLQAIRCTFPLNATGSWNGSVPDVARREASLVLRFEAIGPDTGTAQLRNGAVRSDVIVRASAGYLHFMQVFRTGPLYTTTVFERAGDGQLKAVHSRHEYLTPPLPGTTSSPEQYYGECERGE